MLRREGEVRPDGGDAGACKPQQNVREPFGGGQCLSESTRNATALFSWLESMGSDSNWIKNSDSLYCFLVGPFLHLPT